MGNMATYRPARTQQDSWNSMKADMRAYQKLQGYHDQIADTTPHDCELCGLNYGGFDLIMHLHFGHKVDYSDICPCDGCVLVQLNKSIDEERQQRAAFAKIERFFAESEKQKTVQTATAPMVDLTASPVFSGQVVKNAPVAQHHNASVAPSANGPQQQYSPVKASPSLSSLPKHAVQGTLAPMGNAQVIRIDSMSPAPQLSSPFAPAQTNQNKTQPTVVQNIRHTRVDSAMSMHPLSAPSTVAKPSQPARGKPKRVTTKPKPVLENIRFYQIDKQHSEKNLPYEVSKIECGQMYEDNGKVIWVEQKADAPNWLDGNDNIVKSIVTGKNMRWCPCLPHNIPNDIPAWQIVSYYRQAAAEGYSLRQADFIDRGLKLTSSGISNRVQKWQSGIGMLPQTRSTFYNWPSKQAMDTVAGLNYNQARFNTWWEVGFSPSHGAWAAKQPNSHPGYRDLDSFVKKDTETQPPFYFFDKPESRKVSEYIKLVDDAMLFLTIKAEECGMTGGYQELLPWFGKPAEDQWTRDLDADLIIEFGRWREGCRDTPSVAVLRNALEHAGSVAEVEAIKRADYSLTPWLQDVVAGLAPMKESRRFKDAQKRGEVASRVANRVTEKRKIGEVDGVEMGDGQSKKRAV